MMSILLFVCVCLRHHVSASTVCADYDTIRPRMHVNVCDYIYNILTFFFANSSILQFCNSFVYVDRSSAYIDKIQHLLIACYLRDWIHENIFKTNIFLPHKNHKLIFWIRFLKSFLYSVSGKKNMGEKKPTWKNFVFLCLYFYTVVEILADIVAH